jgi:hypothetical protein
MLEDYIREISRAKSTIQLSGFRAKLQGLLKNNDISMGIYQGLNRDIRDRADWLKGRK